MEPGIYDGLSADQYHASPGISKSGLAVFADSPARFRYGDPITTRSQMLGSLVHSAILEPEQVEDRYHVVDLDVLDERHAAYKRELHKARGRELVRRRDLHEALRVRDAVYRHPIARRLLAGEGNGGGNIIERSFVWRDPATGTLCRGRADCINPALDAVVDLKSSKDASLRSWRHDARRYRYHWQEAMYSDGLAIADGWRPAHFLFVVVEPVRPYLTSVYRIRPDHVQRAREEVAEALRRFAQCVQTDTWPGLPEGIQDLDLPGYDQSGIGREAAA